MLLRNSLPHDLQHSVSIWVTDKYLSVINSSTAIPGKYTSQPASHSANNHVNRPGLTEWCAHMFRISLLRTGWKGWLIWTFIFFFPVARMITTCVYAPHHPLNRVKKAVVSFADKDCLCPASNTILSVKIQMDHTWWNCHVNIFYLWILNYFRDIVIKICASSS